MASIILQTDEQTIADLKLFGKNKGQSIYDLYNRTNTHGGERLLDTLFRHPLSDETAINKRLEVIKCFVEIKANFPFSGLLFDRIERYLAESTGAVNSAGGSATMSDNEIQQGVDAILELLRLTAAFVSQPAIIAAEPYAAERMAIEAFLNNKTLVPVFRNIPKGRLSYEALAAYDNLFRLHQTHLIKLILDQLYQLDVYISIANTAGEKGFVFPNVRSKGTSILKFEGLYHPAVANAVPNDFNMNEDQNMVFLTGANMAGKSTFLRAVSTALYLAHVGLPVAASAMEFSVMDGLYTTVNLPDNLGIGASHFYVEVLRVKKIATELHAGKALFVLFDELFRGTNVKDAHEATVAIIRKFAEKQNSLFIISSHILEAGESIMGLSNVGFRYLPTRMNGTTPEYSYSLKEGITEDRHGMIIIRNEKILEILENGNRAGLQENNSSPV